MPPLIGIRVVLESLVKSFFPGQLISGKIVIDNEKPVETTGLKIRFDGKARVNWSERVSRKDGNSRKVVNVFYTSEKVYFKEEQILWGNLKDTMILGRGQFAYPFEFLLPNDLPSSFLSRIGTVSYVMEATLRIPDNRSDVVSIVPFTVNGILDLNMEPGAKVPFETRRYKSICCLCCTSGPVGFLFRLPRRAYVPGEVIAFTAELSNQSGQKIHGMKVSLVQVCKFHADGNSNSTMRPIRSVQGPEVDPGDTEVWAEKMLRIPPIPPTRLATCKIIDVQYVLHLELNLPSLSINLREEIPITIGTIPLRDTFTILRSDSDSNLGPDGPLSHSGSKTSLTNVVDNNDNAFGASGDFQMTTVSERPRARSRGLSISSDHPSFVDYPNCPPPTYEEAVMLDRSPEEENSCFTPDEGSGNVGPTSSSSQLAIPGSSRGASSVAAYVPQYVTYGGSKGPK